MRCRRLGRGRHRVVCGTMEAGQQGRAAGGGQLHTACIERVNLTIRQQVAAVGRRVTTLGKREAGGRQQPGWYHVSYHCC